MCALAQGIGKAHSCQLQREIRCHASLQCRQYRCLSCRPPALTATFRRPQPAVTTFLGGWSVYCIRHDLQLHLRSTSGTASASVTNGFLQSSALEWLEHVCAKSFAVARLCVRILGSAVALWLATLLVRPSEAQSATTSHTGAQLAAVQGARATTHATASISRALSLAWSTTDPEPSRPLQVRGFAPDPHTAASTRDVTSPPPSSSCPHHTIPLADLAASTAGPGGGGGLAVPGPLLSSPSLAARFDSSRGSILRSADPVLTAVGTARGPSGLLIMQSPASGSGGSSGVTAAGSSGGGVGSGAAGSSSSSTGSSASGVAAAAAGPSAAPEADPEDVALAQQLGVGVSEAGVVRLFERHRASVVNISGMRSMQTFTTLDLAKVPYGQGSGLIWGEKGHVVTCYHVVRGVAEVKVTLHDNTSYTAKVLGYDTAKNLAVLKLSVPKSKLRELQPVTLGSAAALRVGQTVYGICNPWGLGHTLSKGLVCGLGLELPAGLFPIKGAILTDTPVDSGSSGGALLDGQGALVGLVVAPPSNGGTAGGRGSFAVPIDAVRGLINQILMYGRTIRPALGITLAPAQVLERVGQDGVLVLEVPPGSPAHAAGLRHTHRDIFGDLVLGDIIVGLDGKAVRTASDLYDILDEHRVGDRVKLDVVRDGKQTGLTVTLGERQLGAADD